MELIVLITKWPTEKNHVTDKVIQNKHKIFKRIKNSPNPPGKKHITITPTTV